MLRYTVSQFKVEGINLKFCEAIVAELLVCERESQNTNDAMLYQYNNMEHVHACNL